jgi:hypothetical protein
VQLDDAFGQPRDSTGCELQPLELRDDGAALVGGQRAEKCRIERNARADVAQVA